MASKLAVALMEEDSIRRIEAALPGFTMPLQGRDPMLLRAQQLRAIAEWLECNKPTVTVASQWVNKPLIDTNVTTTTNTQLEAFAAAINAEDSQLKMPQPAPKGKGKR